MASNPSESEASVILPPQLEGVAKEIFNSTMSPFCPGLLISDCPSGKATELKDQIRLQLSQGRSEDQVRTELQQRFAANLDARPPAGGFGALMWIVPVALLLVGFVVAMRWIKSQVATK